MTTSTTSTTKNKIEDTINILNGMEVNMKFQELFTHTRKDNDI